MNEYSDEIHQHVPKAATNEWAHLDPSRWWFASSAFPMIAGTLGPVASAFSICALVKPWRQSYPPGTDVTTAPFIPDPPWLTAINAVQLVIAIFANLALFLNMTRRLSFTIAQPVTIVGWYISSFALIALTATASGPLVIQPAEDFIWSQAFYYGIYSAVLYFLVASLMVVTYACALAGRYPKDFMLTPSQRTLMLQTIMFLLYLEVGALVFCKIEGWMYLDAVYWAAVTLFTVGFGDIYANTVLGRSLLMPFSLVGIISLGLVIGSIRSLVLDRGKTRLGARMVEKKRRRTLRRMTRRGNDEILVPIKDDPPTLSSVRTDSSGLTEFERREREFRLMRKIQDVAARRRRWFAMSISTSTWLVLWLLGAKVFEECEARYQGWTYFDGFYFSFVSLTTIGYGDMTPVSNAGRSFWVFWALLALPTMTVLISNAGDTIVKGIRDATDQIATVTILPSEAGFKKDLKKLLRMLSFGVLFDKESPEQEPPGFLGHPQRLKEAARADNKDDDAKMQCTKTRPTSKPKAPTPPPPKRSAPITTPKKTSTRAESKPPRKKEDEGTSHPPRDAAPQAPPPRKYTFHEWAWYLRLIGEDEADAERHRKANGHRHAHDQAHGGRGTGTGTGTGSTRGSSVGGRGGGGGKTAHLELGGEQEPVMGSQEEAEWILERLIARLADELRAVNAEHHQHQE
ncbi:hypothetical protein NEMBOFW57_008359 [Staphylotrichum longicolle]|uniref:Potassium channel domain-containing protein n=1 Tax=Staphylotrichum longicolle TaxID=669026 RepID=A0AAD4ERH3_9PEZI|nr:hypothetical protein NEMBOFW57_008359 [Staphylotrichum longicolle]